MDKGLYSFIWRYSKRQQIIVCALTVASFPFLYMALQLPKIIVNDALGSGGTFPMEFVGLELDQMAFLLSLCGALLVLLLVNGCFLMGINVSKGVLSERMLRRLRYQLFERILRFPLGHFQKVSQGELSAMIVSEVEPLGEFFGDSYALPMFQGGTLLTILAFLFAQDPILGIVSIALVPIQIWVIPKLQTQVNMLKKERVKLARKMSGRIGEAVSGVHDVHTLDTSRYSLAEFSRRLWTIFGVRYQIYFKKHFMKFVNNFLIALTPLLFYSVGGVLIIRGELTLGALVAALAAYAGFATPWKELLRYYQVMADSKIKYEQLREQFDIKGMMDPALQSPRPEVVPRLNAAVSLNAVNYADDDGITALNEVTFRVEPSNRTAIVASGIGREKLAHMLGRLLAPSQGRITIGDEDLSALHETVTGTRIGYAGPEFYIFDGTIADNVLYGLKHRPATEGEMSPEREKEFREAKASGNSTASIDVDWMDYEDLGITDQAGLTRWLQEVFRALEMDDMLYARAMYTGISSGEFSELADGIMRVRDRLAGQLRAHPELAEMVHVFDYGRFNTTASVGANLIFGEPVGPEFAFENLGRNDYVTWVLEECGLTDRLHDIGLKVASTLAEMFTDLAPGEPLFERFSFVDEDSLEELRRLAARAELGGLDGLSDADKTQLLTLAFQLIVDRHRLGFVDDEVQQQILKARSVFWDNLADDKRRAVAKYDPEKFNDQLSLRCNVLMGHLNLNRPQAEERVDGLILDIFNELEIRDNVVQAGTNAQVGVGGARLTLAARQTIAFARSVVKRPDILVVNEALSALERESRERIRRNVGKLLPETTLIWIDSEMPNAVEFDQVLVLRDGRIADRIVEHKAEEAEAAPVEEAAPEPVPADTEGPTILNAETAVLREVPLFAHIDQSRLKLMAFTSQRLTLAAGEEIFHEDDPGDAAYVILEGEADVIIGEGDRETVVNQVGVNEMVGELALLSSVPRSATVRATMELTVLQLKKEVFLELIEREPRVAAQLACQMSDRLAQTMQRLREAA